MPEVNFSKKKKQERKQNKTNQQTKQNNGGGYIKGSLVSTLQRMLLQGSA